MLSLLGEYGASFWGPLRLFKSHAFLLAAGTLFAGILVWTLLPRLWKFLPHDHGKTFVQGGEQSKGKPTGGGFFVTLLTFPALFLFVPPSVWAYGLLFCLYGSMLFGYLDDRSVVPWGRMKKGLLDVVVSVGAAFFVWMSTDGTVWLPFVKGVWTIPWWAYLPCGGFLLWFVMNATNCSDGVDGLAGTLTLITLFLLGALLYLVVGYAPVAKYLLVPANAHGAVWAILLMSAAGGVAGYLWYNAEPSKVLMGDAGSRFLGLLVGAGVLASGNPFLVFAFAPVVLVNGGAGLGKIVLLKLCRKTGMDDGTVVMRLLKRYRFPLHDHCKRELHWTNAQVLMRFTLIQAFLTPLVFVLLVKIR